MKKRSIHALRAKASAQKNALPMDPLLEMEDKELKRMERLLGISKSKNKQAVIDKLNKEYEMEGIGEGFGSFLMSLDDIIGSGGGDDGAEDMFEDHEFDEPPKEKKSKKSKVRAREDDELEPAVDLPLEKQESNASSDRNSTSEVKASSSMYIPPSKRQRPGSSTSAASTLPTANAPAAVVPETKQEKALRKLQRFVQGTMNRLTEETKDSILQEIKEIYDVNDHQLITSLILDCLFSYILAAPQKILLALPLFASFLAALQMVIGDVIASSVVHQTLDRFLGVIEADVDLDWSKQSHNLLLLIVYLQMLKVLDLSLIIDILHLLFQRDEYLVSRQVSKEHAAHRIFEVLNRSPQLSDSLRSEYIDIILCRVGDKLRKEEPTILQGFLQQIRQQLEEVKAANQSGTTGGFSRRQFVLESLSDFDCKRMQKVREKHAEEVRTCRQWLNTVHRSFRSVIVQQEQAQGGHHIPQNLLAIITGRNSQQAAVSFDQWGNVKVVIPTKNVSSLLADATTTSASISSTTASNSNSTSAAVEAFITKKSAKLRLNTPNRRAIFRVLLQCRDVDDAYEKIIALHLGNTFDRDLVRVLLECVGQEKTYNAFYVELLKTFCTAMPPCKLSAEIAFFDEMTAMIALDNEALVRLQNGDEDEDEKQRAKTEMRLMHLARLLAELLLSFKVSLAVLRKFDLAMIQRPAEMGGNAYTVLFLSTLFLRLFTYDPAGDSMATSPSSGSKSHTNGQSNEDAGLDLVLQVADRLGRSKHYESVRQIVLTFLRQHMKTLPPAIKADEALASRVKRARAMMIRAMKDMSVLHNYTTEDTATERNHGQSFDFD